MVPIFHIANSDALNHSRTSGFYRAPSMDSEGFIHCCTAVQLRGVVGRYYSNETGLTLLRIDTTKLTKPPVLENTVGGDELFPHVYQELPMRAIVGETVFDAVDVDALDWMDRR
jgi:uncharacterized protein (DUF952 family)